MRGYRLFIFDRAGARVESERQFHAVDDRTALQLVDGWRGTRRAALWRANCEIQTWAAGAGKTPTSFD
jgi:hypothetical protein